MGSGGVPGAVVALPLAGVDRGQSMLIFEVFDGG